MKFKEEKKFAGHRDQLFRINRLTMQDGKESGVQLIDISNRSGMHFDVNTSRGLDIPYFEYHGENIGYISPCGIVHPSYFDDKGLGFLKSFTAGFLTTCGLKSIGSPGEYEGKEYGLHGNISNTPAENVSHKVIETDEPYLKIEGDVRDALIFGDRMTLHRTIRCNYKERKIYLHDTVTNDGSRRARHMILYHCNIGYPLLTPSSEVYIPSLEVTPRNEHSATGVDHWMNLEEPNPQYEEMCYYHRLKRDENNYARVAVFNPELGFGVSIEFDAATLDQFVQWKMMGANDYVLGLEPGNATIDSLSDAISNGSMKYLQPDESVEYHLTFSILDGRCEFEAMKNYMNLGE
ncbi:MAG: aldose 1-epimerase family protein [Sphaerochaeta sp.]